MFAYCRYREISVNMTVPINRLTVLIGLALLAGLLIIVNSLFDPSEFHDDPNVGKSEKEEKPKMPIKVGKTGPRWENRNY